MRHFVPQFTSNDFAALPLSLRHPVAGRGRAVGCIGFFVTFTVRPLGSKFDKPYAFGCLAAAIPARAPLAEA